MANPTQKVQQNQPVIGNNNGHVPGAGCYAAIAENLWEQGWLPVPLEDGNPKKPAIRYKKIAANGMSRRELHNLIKQFPNNNIATIVPKGRVCADFDAGTTAGLHLPVTLAVNARRGPHFWYECSENLATTKIVVNGQMIGDIKAAGSIMVLPPSLIRGHQYEWMENLSPNEIQIATAPDWIRTGKMKGSTTPGTQTSQLRNKNRNISVLVPRTSTSAPALGFPVPGDLASFSLQPDVLAHVLSFLGIPADATPGGSCFPCVLPGHTEKSPSASLFLTDHGFINYRDWHLRDGREWYSLPEIFVSQLRGRVFSFKNDDPAENWSNITHLVWQIRLFIESGALRISRPALVPSITAPDAAHKVADALSLLFAARWLLSPGSPVPFTWRFAKEWACLGTATLEEGMKTLFREKIIKVADVARIGGRTTNLYLPA